MDNFKPFKHFTQIQIKRHLFRTDAAQPKTGETLTNEGNGVQGLVQVAGT